MIEILTKELNSKLKTARYLKKLGNEQLSKIYMDRSIQLAMDILKIKKEKI